MPKTKLTLLLTMLALPGCALTPQTNEVQRLRNHPQYETALMAAPEWTSDALNTINDLEQRLNTQ
jgi:uncharacterized lipoprotein YajG